MHRPSSSGVLCVAFVACASAPSGLYAQPASPTDSPATTSTEVDSEVAEARRRYQQGAEFYRRGRYEEAVAEFTEAYELWQNPLILYALGQAYEGLSEVNRAIATYTRYLETAPADDARRSEVESKIRELERLLATVHVQSNVPATVYVDGEAVGSAPGDFRLATGRREVELRADGYVSGSQTLIVAGGTERTLGFVLEPVPVATTQLVRVESPPFRFPRPVFITAVSLTAASAATWGSLATVTLVRANAYNDDPDRTNLERARARDFARNADVMLGVTAGLAVGTTLVGIFTDFDGDDESEEDGPVAPSISASIEPVSGGAVVTARWTR